MGNPEDRRSFLGKLGLGAIASIVPTRMLANDDIVEHYELESHTEEPPEVDMKLPVNELFVRTFIAVSS